MAKFLVWFGVILVFLGFLFSIFFHTLMFAPQLVIGGLLLIVGIMIERWRYKSIVEERPKSNWTDTGERFIDPETEKLTGVYLDPSGERHYVAMDR
jgi:hypothetical protein